MVDGTPFLYSSSTKLWRSHIDDIASVIDGIKYRDSVKVMIS